MQGKTYILEKEDWDNLQTILKLKLITHTEIRMIESFMRKFIDPNCKLCGNCHSQHRFAHLVITNFSKDNIIKKKKK